MSDQAHRSEERSDVELLAAVKAGDRDAFTRLAERHQASLYRYVRSISRTDADAEDALQKTLVAVWKSAATYAQRSSVRAWMLTIGRNAALRAGRSREDATDIEPLADLGRRAGWGADNPETLLLQLQRQEVLARALEALPEPDRELLILRDLEGLTGDEAAEVSGLSLAAMKSRLHRARLKLLAQITEEQNDGA